MRYVIVFPGLGKKVIASNTLRLQPWNYMAQIARSIANGADIVVTSDARIQEDSLRSFTGLDAPIVEFGRSSLLRGDAIVSPVALGVLSRIINLVKNRVPVIGVLTTPLIRLGDAISNYFRVVQSMTQVASGTIIKENIGFRLHRNALCKISVFIVPSKDLANRLMEMLGCEAKVAVLYPYPEIGVVKALKGEGEGITYFGPFTEERGVISLIKAYSAVVKRVHEHKLRLFLRPTGSRRLGLAKKLLVKLGNSAELIIGSLGKDTLMHKVSESKVVALPYRFVASTVPLAYFEALFLRGPVVLSTDAPGIGEHVRAYISEVLPTTYSPKELADALLRLLTDSRLYSSVRNAQYEHTSSIMEEAVAQARNLPRWLGDSLGRA